MPVNQFDGRKIITYDSCSYSKFIRNEDFFSNSHIDSSKYNSGKIKYTYIKGLLSSEYRYDYNNIILDSTIYIYNNQNMCIRITINSKYGLSTTWQYFYNSDNLLANMVFFDPLVGLRLLTTYFYDDEKRLKKISTLSNREIDNCYYEDTYLYYENSKITKFHVVSNEYCELHTNDITLEYETNYICLYLNGIKSILYKIDKDEI